MSDLKVEVSQIIHAPIAKVFDAWLNPKMLSQFMLPMPGMPAPEVELDAQEGGRFTIIMQVGDDKIPHTGTYQKIEQPHTLVFTWESPRSADNSTVTINFTEIETDKTKVDLTQVKFIDEGSKADHEGGWSNILAALQKADIS